MFDLAWSEIALIAVVAVVVIGPKDLPDAVRGVAKSIQKLRRMAGEFQGQLDEVVREAKLEDVRDQIRDIRNFDIKGAISKHVDDDGSIRKTFTEDPIRDAFKDSPPPLPTDASKPVTDAPIAPVPVAAVAADAPAFIPPAEVGMAGLTPDVGGLDPATTAYPAFVPPDAALPPPEAAGEAVMAAAAPAVPPVPDAAFEPAPAPVAPLPAATPVAAATPVVPAPAVAAPAPIPPAETGTAAAADERPKSNLSA